jgi:hypothetical protein
MSIPVAWKTQFPGNYHLNGVRPPKNGALFQPETL